MISARYAPSAAMSSCGALTSAIGSFNNGAPSYSTVGIVLTSPLRMSNPRNTGEFGDNTRNPPLCGYPRPNPPRGKSAPMLSTVGYFRLLLVQLMLLSDGFVIGSGTFL